MHGASQVAPAVRRLPANAGHTGGTGVIPGLEISPEGGHGNPLQRSYLENTVDRRAWRAMVHRVTKRWTRLKCIGLLRKRIQPSLHWLNVYQEQGYLVYRPYFQS